MNKIFVSYRREDSAYAVQAIVDRLKSHFGRDAIFFDQDAIDCGDDYIVRIYEALFTCHVVLAVIGKRWLDARHEDGPKVGTRRIDDPSDLVRREVEIALRRQVVIPVLVDGTSMPRRDQLPSKISKLANKNAVEVRTGKDFDDDMNRLVAIINRKLPSRWRSRLVVAAISVACLLVGMASGWFVGRTTPPPRDGQNGEVRSMVDNVRRWTPAEVEDRLNGLKGLLDDHRWEQTASIAQAEKLNQELAWLPIKLNLVRDDETFSGVRERMRRALDDAVRIVHQQTEDVRFALVGKPIGTDQFRQRLALLEAYLADIRDLGDLKQTAEHLIEAKQNYWELHRLYVVKRLAEIGKGAASLKPVAALGTYVLELRYLAQFTRHCRVGDANGRKTQVQDDLNAALTFCEERRAAGSYKVTPKVALTLTSDELIDDNLRAITLETPGVDKIRLGFWPADTNKLPIELKRVVREDTEKTIGLGTLTVGIHVRIERAQGQWDWPRVHTFPADLPGVPERLRALGMLLVEEQGQSVEPPPLEHKGHKVKIEFTGLPVAPRLLWEASMRE